MTDMLSAFCDEHGSSDHPAPVYGRPRSRGPLDLLPTVDRAVIPRLHAALQRDLRRPRHPLISVAAEPIEDVSDFAERMLAGDLDGAKDRIDAMRRGGRPLERIYLDVLAPTACRLRDLWSEDFCGFADMTLALSNLQSLLRFYASDFYAEAMLPDSGLRVLVVAASGNGIDLLTPMFGLVLMSQFFRREGWSTSIERDLASGSFLQTIRDWFDVVEVLGSNDSQLDAIASGIRAIRRGSPNRSIGVVVCGPIFSDRPDYIRLVGADMTASDPLSSLSQAKSFVTGQTPHRRLS